MMLAFIWLQLFWVPNFAEPATQETIDRTKKIVMMLNIAGKEFEEGVVDGKIVVAAEYEESQLFLEQAIERFERISAEINKTGDAENLKKRFLNITSLIKSKAGSRIVWDEINNINADLLATFKIQINKIPIRTITN